MGHSGPSIGRRGPQETQERPKEVQCMSASPLGRSVCARGAVARYWRAWRLRMATKTTPANAVDSAPMSRFVSAPVFARVPSPP